MQGKYKVLGYRWIILAVIVPIIISTEMFWLTLSPIASLAENYYHVGSMSISLFSMSYMIMYVIFTLPASWVVDKYGYRCSLIIGALITAIFGIVRVAFFANFTAQIICQFIIAIGQPFLLNISTKVPANWFPLEERSIAAGILTLAQYLGFIVPMVLSPVLAESYDFQTLLTVYAAIACVSALLSIVFTRERPHVLPGPEISKDNLSIRSMSRLFHNRNFMYVLILVFISMGIFNTLLTLIESILTPQGITMEQAGLVGAVFVVSGVIGAIVLPIISDKIHRRTPLFIIGISLLVPLYLGMTFLHSFIAVAITAGLAGFAIMGVAPILFQHGAEVAYPANEGTSMGLILLMGQISGAVFVALFEGIGQISHTMVVPMLIAVAATALEIPLTLKMRESNILLNSTAENGNAKKSS